MSLLNITKLYNSKCGPMDQQHQHYLLEMQIGKWGLAPASLQVLFMVLMHVQA
jgi:hypothetical protein